MGDISLPFCSAPPLPFPSSGLCRQLNQVPPPPPFHSHCAYLMAWRILAPYYRHHRRSRVAASRHHFPRWEFRGKWALKWPLSSVPPAKPASAAPAKGSGRRLRYNDLICLFNQGLSGRGRARHDSSATHGHTRRGSAGLG